MDVSSVFTLVLALLWSPLTPEKNKQKQTRLFNCWMLHHVFQLVTNVAYLNFGFLHRQKWWSWGCSKRILHKEFGGWWLLIFSRFQNQNWRSKNTRNGLRFIYSNISCWESLQPATQPVVRDSIPFSKHIILIQKISYNIKSTTYYLKIWTTKQAWIYE